MYAECVRDPQQSGQAGITGPGLDALEGGTGDAGG